MASSNRIAFSRQGLHRLECSCGAYVYATVASLETHGLPSCACGIVYSPARRELGDLLGVPCRAVVEFETAQALGKSAAEAAVWVEERRQEIARHRRMAAIGQA